MCKTRIKIIRGFIDSEGIEELEAAVNMFIADLKNKVAKVNSVKFEVYNSKFTSITPTFAVINYELGD